jgi:hypothetical protein
MKLRGEEPEGLPPENANLDAPGVLNVMAVRARVVKICESLPEVVVTPAGDRNLAFGVRMRKFAYFLDDHHRDGMLAINCKTEMGMNTTLISCDPVHFHAGTPRPPRLDRASRRSSRRGLGRGS